MTNKQKFIILPIKRLCLFLAILLHVTAQYCLKLNINSWWLDFFEIGNLCVHFALLPHTLLLNPTAYNISLDLAKSSWVKLNRLPNDTFGRKISFSFYEKGIPMQLYFPSVNVGGYN